MANYPIPPWLSPSAAQEYGALAGEASRANLSAELQRERMSQEATQFAIESQQRSQQTAAEMQARQEQLNYQHHLEQQKIAIENAYHQQQLGLQAADLDLAQKQFEAKSKDAANKFTANQAFQKAMLPPEQGGEGLSSTQAAIKYIAPYMTGTELARLTAIPTNFKPGATMAIPNSLNEQLVQVGPNRWEKSATIPQTVTNAPTVIPVPDTEGNNLGNVIQIPGQKPIFDKTTKSGESELDTFLKNRLGKAPDKKVSTAVDSKETRKAQGGYKIGLVYKGGLKYLGGDPNDESSWEKVK